MNNRKKMRGIAAIASIALVAAACGSSSDGDSDGGADSGMPSSVAIGGGPDGGVYAVASAGLAQIINEHVDGVRASTQATAASLENTRLVRDKEVTFGLADTMVSVHGIRGIVNFEDDGPAENLRYVTGGYPALLSWMVKADSDIETLADFKGKSLCLAPGIQSNVLAEALTIVDLTSDDLDVTIDEYSGCADRLAQGSVDIFQYHGGASSSIVIEAAAKTDLRFVTLPDDAHEKIVGDYPWWVPGEIPAGTYEAEGLPLKTISTRAGLFLADKDTSEELVYNVVKALDENIEEFKKLHPTMAEYAFPAGASSGVATDVLQVHPGAARYYEEMGYTS